VLLHY